MTKNYKGIIKFISKPGKNWAVVKEYRDVAKGDTSISNAYVLSTVAPINAVAGVVNSTVAPNASEQFTMTTSAYNVNITVDGIARTVDISGDAGASETYSAASIITRINAAFGVTVASKTDTGVSARIRITSNTIKGTVTVAAGTTNSALTNVFNATTLTNTGTAELFNLSSVYNVRIAVDGGTLTTVNLQGATPASTTMDEIITNINTTMGATIASKVGVGNSARIKVQSTSAKTTSSISIQAGSSQDALSAVFNATTLSDVGGGYESIAAGYRIIKASGLSSKVVGDKIEYNYSYGNNITIL